jgi:hypothetical protein
MLNPDTSPGPPIAAGIAILGHFLLDNIQTFCIYAKQKSKKAEINIIIINLTAA